MDATFFRLKRAHHGVLRLGRVPLKEMGLTAARFDLLFALTYEGLERASAIWQSVIRRMLGVSRATVSRMMISLENLRFVRRQKSQEDRRQLEVELSDEGWFRIREAYKRLTWNHWALLALHSAMSGVKVGESTWLDVDPNMIEHRMALDGYLDKVRRGFGDFATLTYPWIVEDD